eukprot:jgi/Chlat1/4959/Chrsp32S04924
MVVCKCRKATKWYCFVHKTPVCGDCVCTPLHTICVVRTYSEWVIDGDYDWPPKCASCSEVLTEEGLTTVRLACLHVTHEDCLQKHVQSFPSITAPAGYVCPACPAALWPPRESREANSALGTNLKAVILKTAAADVLLSNNADSKTSTSHGGQPPAGPPFSYSPTSATPPVPSAATLPISIPMNGTSPNGPVADGQGSPPSQAMHHISRKGSARLPPGSTAVIIAQHEHHYNDNDAMDRKYARRGNWYTRLLQQIPGLASQSGPSHAREAAAADELIGSDMLPPARRRRKRSRLDPQKLLIAFALLSSLATMVLLYVRLSI